MPKVFHLPLLAAAIALTASAHAQVDPASGIDFVTIGAVGNAPRNVPNSGFVNRGSVGYEYKIGRYEVTTAQWTEFFNAALDRPSNDRIPWVVSPEQWGAQPTTPTTAGGRRWAVPTGNEMRAVGGITWRTAAIYCNWLHNGKGTSRDALLSGAYDVSTFSGGFGFTDQLTRSAGARFFIPSLDEWMKAAHYDPTKANPDGTTGGWWNFANGRDDRAPIYGPAGFTRDGQPTEANAAWNNWTPQVNPFSIPLGAYNVTSPWGLYDTSGAGAEWTEEYLWFQPIDPLPRSRYADGGYWTGGSTLPDTAGAVAAGDHPGFQDWIYGFRVASIPSPGSGGLVVVFACALAQRRRRFPRP